MQLMGAKENLDEKNQHILLLQEELVQKDKNIAALQQEVQDLEEKRQREEDEKLRKRNIDEKERKWYAPVRGDTVDELMARYLNACPHYVPVKRLGEGQYMYGSKKIFAKIMNEKLIIRVGGGFMLIDEFLANYAELEMEKDGSSSFSRKRAGSPGLAGLRRSGNASPRPHH